MEIPQNVQDKLKCSECDELLSCGPVFLLHETGGTICGRCSQISQKNHQNKKNDRTRNGLYEATASLLAFPCAHASRGCPEKVQFSLGRPPHELSCKFRPFICPVAPRGSCDWIGSALNLKEHCEEKHPLNLFENPCNLPRPDLTISNLQTYVISAISFLFLLHVKVCVTSGKLFHCLRMFGDSELLNKFSYTFEIEGNDSKFVKKGSVLPVEILMLQEPTAICCFINNLLGNLNGKYDESKFTITIQTSIRNCLNCIKNIEDSDFCGECQGKLVKCKFNDKDCLFVDVNKTKCRKHELLFCKYQTKCWFCKVDFVDDSLIEHLSSSISCRKTQKAFINTVIRLIKNTSLSFNYILFSSHNIETIICFYKLSNSNLELLLCTSLPSHELKDFKCSIELTDPRTKHTEIFTPQIQYNILWDWYIDEEIKNFPSCINIGIDIKVTLDKSLS